MLIPYSPAFSPLHFHSPIPLLLRRPPLCRGGEAGCVCFCLLSQAGVFAIPGHEDMATEIPEGFCLCSNCRFVVSADDAMAAGNGTRRCKACNRLQSRVHRMCNSHNIDSFDVLSPEERITFFREAQDYFGEDLQKCITESITRSQTKRITTKFRTFGPLELKSTVAKRYEGQPDKWANILKTAKQFTCPVTLEDMIQIPKYEAETEDVNEWEQKRKREATGDGKLKLKKMKLETKAEGDEPSHPKALTKGQKKKLQALKTKFGKASMDLATQIAAASAPDNKDAVPAKQSHKMHELRTKCMEWSAADGNIDKMLNAEKTKHDDLANLLNNGEKFLEQVDYMCQHVAKTIELSKDDMEG